MVFSFIYRILENWLKVKFTGDDSLVDDTHDGAEDIQTLTIFNALSSKGDQTVSVNVCIKVSDSHFITCMISFLYSDITEIINCYLFSKVVLNDFEKIRSKWHYLFFFTS